MCGIVGIVNFDPQAPVDAVQLTRMRDVLGHRGPDGQGMILSGSVGFGHRRLAILDLAGGHQPMTNADRTIWLTYNGEIYNYKSLRAQLIARGFSFTSESDTEVVLRAYQAFGEDCVDHLQGMFAFAIWDERRATLLLARDRLGIKPLYYACTSHQLLFGSEIKAILASNEIRSTFNQAILPEFLASRYCAGAETFFTGINKLLPGRTLSWSLSKGVTERRYWWPSTALDDSPSSLAQQAAVLRSKMEAAVQSHLASDVPVGLFLSGGIDSTGLAAMMAPLLSQPIQSFSVGYDNADCSELDYARMAAESVAAEHREVRVSPSMFFGALPRLIWHEDEPIAFPSSVSLYFVSRLAAQHHVKVVLTGEGADELFLGYNRYRVTAWNERLGRLYQAAMPAMARRSVRQMMHRLPPPLRRFTTRSFLGIAPGVRELFCENFAVFSLPLRQQLVRDGDLLQARDPYAVQLRCFQSCPGSTLERMMHADLQTYLVELLMKQDQMSMAASVESRVPFLDQSIVEYATSLPAQFKLRGWQTKAVLREALRNKIPKPILQRKKMGFPTPFGQWLRGPFSSLCRELVCGPRSRERGLFNPAVAHVLVEEHINGVADHTDRLWLLMNVELWQRVFLEGMSPLSVLTETSLHEYRASGRQQSARRLPELATVPHERTKNEPCVLANGR